MPTPSRSAAIALISPSRWREIRTLARCSGRSHERHHEMLAVPHRHDDRQLGRDALVDIGRLDHEAVGLPDQPKIFGRQHADRLLKRARAR